MEGTEPQRNVAWCVLQIFVAENAGGIVSLDLCNSLQRRMGGIGQLVRRHGDYLRKRNGIPERWLEGFGPFRDAAAAAAAAIE